MRGSGRTLGGATGSIVALVLSTVTPAGLHFERAGDPGGPPPEVVTAIYQDRAGFLWIGSRDGLFRYDGHAFLTFEHDSTNPSSISDHVIRTIFEDRAGNLWIGTNTGGLDRLDRGRGVFEHHRHDATDAASLSHDSVYAVAEDRAGSLWVGTQQGLNRFDPTTGRFERVPLASDYAVALLVDRRDRLWVGTVNGGVAVRDAETGRFRALRHDERDPHSVPSDQVFALLEDSTGRVWIGTQRGVAWWDDAQARFERRPEFGHTLVTSLAEDMEGRVWCGTNGDGVQVLDPRTGQTGTYRHDPGDPGSLGDDRVPVVSTDRGGSVWIGSWGGGLQRVTAAALLLAQREDLARPGAGAPPQRVGAIVADRAGRLWVGTLAGRLLCRDLARGSERELRPALGQDWGQVLALLVDRRDRIWAATAVALGRIDPLTDRVTVLRHDERDPTSLGSGYVTAVYEDGAGRIWVGTGEGGLHRLDEAGRVVARFRNDPTDPHSLSDDYVTAIAEDRRRTLWVGTRSGGLNELDPTTGRSTRHLPAPDDPASIGHHSVTAILEDTGGHLWVATAGGGIHRVDRHAGRVAFHRFTEADGLVDNDVMTLAEDTDRSLWLSTRRGLSRFVPETGAVVSYGVADGLPGGEFEPRAVAWTGDTLFFGGVRGLVAVPLGTAFPAGRPAPIALTSIRTATGEVRGETVELPHGEWLALELAVLDYAPRGRQRYEYRLGDASRPWIDLGEQRGVTFTDLEPGVHAFAARGRDARGNWSVLDSALRIRVVPPFWMTSWFRAAGLVAVVLSIVFVHRLRTGALERRNRDLLDRQAEREKAQRELRAAYDRLRLLTRRLEAAKEEERKTIARELHDDLGPTLTAVIINLQLMGNEPRVADSIELVDRLVQRTRDLSLDLRPPLLDELGLVAALSGYLETQAERAGLDLDVRVCGLDERVGPELEIAAFRVVQEAITNVIRHARTKRAKVEIARRDGRLEIEVEDDGTGFDVPAVLEGGASGRAVGLLGMQERVRGLGGEVEIESSPGRGARVRASLPLEVRT